MAEFTASIIGTNSMGGIPCKPFLIIANAAQKGAIVTELTITWKPHRGGITNIFVKVDKDIKFPLQETFVGSMFQFQRVARSKCSSPVSITEQIDSNCLNLGAYT